MSSLISCGLSPNVEKEDFNLAIKLLFSPGRWIKGESADDLEEKLNDLFDGGKVICFESGRSALLAILDNLGLEPGDEVLLQAYTCVAVPDAILWAGAKPVYVDINAETFNMSLQDLKNKITKKSKAIIIQHTFGTPAQINEIIKVARAHDIFTIEDCAHSLGAKYQGKPTGSFADAAILSFGRDKVISSVFGGAVITADKKFFEKIIKYKNGLIYPSNKWVAKQLMHPVLTTIIKSTYGFLNIGKLLMFLLSNVGLLSKAIDPEEKVGRKPKHVPTKMPNALSALAIQQLSRLEKFNKKRQAIASIYLEDLKGIPVSLPDKTRDSIYLRFTIGSKEQKELMNYFKKSNIYLGDWYTNAVAPNDVNQKSISYIQGSCPVAEKAAQQSINLPTNPNLKMEEAKNITNLLKQFYASRS